MTEQLKEKVEAKAAELKLIVDGDWNKLAKAVMISELRARKQEAEFALHHSLHELRINELTAELNELEQL